MAHYFLRWWKTRFFNGYKQFSSSDDDGDDKSQNVPANNLQNDDSKNSCCIDGVPPLREFSFTLYDFEGHGKVSKDDIAGLVTTIYESLGSSIEVPHYGSRTITVKLTVPQNSDRTNLKRPLNHNSKSYTKDFNVTKEKRQSQVLGHNLYDHHLEKNKSMDSYRNCGKYKSSYLQKQQLLRIIQANMEKNNLNVKSGLKRNQQWSPEKDKAWSNIGKNDIIGRHYQKHMQREAEQARARAQVVKWLDQAPKYKHMPSECFSHRHIHEHIHHHYHHYKVPPHLTV